MFLEAEGLSHPFTGRMRGRNILPKVCIRRRWKRGRRDEKGSPVQSYGQWIKGDAERGGEIVSI